MVKLSKYTQAQNTAAETTAVNDLNTPYTFKNWIERNTGVLSGKENLQYENYVKQWYKNKQEEVPVSVTVKEDYIQLLKQLTIAFKSEADSLWASDINWDDNDEIEQIIPFYATKLKEIAIYLINKREAVRRAKLKYNMTGTYPAIERVFYEYLLKAFTKRQFPGNEYITNITDISLLNAIPELSAVRSNFQIFVEELYDDASYFDRDPSLPVSAYFTFNSDATSYLENLNISPSDYEWLYNTGVTQLCADNPLLWSVQSVIDQHKNGIPLSAVELYDSDVLNDYNRIKLTQKYLGEQQYILSGGYWIPWSETVDFNFASTNNWFYWLTGENVFENDTAPTIDPIHISATNLIENGATAGRDIVDADIIYITRDNLLSGAWLKLIDKETFNVTMSARFNRGKNAFAFPFPGFGLSGEDLDWTGRSLDNLDQTFYYLDKESQQAVYTAYWNTALTSLSSFTPMYINDTTLIESSAKASEKFSEADYIITRSFFRDDNPDYIYTGEQEYAWLYKMLKTDIPVKTGGNNIYWPFERYNDNISMFASANQCKPINLIDVPLNNFVGAVAGHTVKESDIIYKKTSPNSSEYVEGAWLKGTPLPQPLGIINASMVSGCYQPNIAMKILGGAYGSFIWTDNTLLANNVFTNIRHQTDCEYLKNTQFSLFKERPTQEREYNYNQWQDCNCRAIVYSPLGHPGNTFDDFGQMADFIIAITSPISSFSFKDWKGIDGRDYKASNEFGWYKLNSGYVIEPDVGWGSGEWITYTGAPFLLSANVMYLYYRNDMHRDNANANVPYLVTKHKNNNIQNTWTKLYLDKQTNTWKDANIASDMIISPGDILYYDHKETCSFILTSSHFEYSIHETAVLPDFNNYNIKATLNETSLPVYDVNVPIQIIDPNDDAATASVITSGAVSATYYGMPTGAFTVSASIENLLPVTLTTILSTITTVKIDYYTYTNNAINFIVNVPLSGWNYNNSIYDGVSLGARPFWAIASDKDDDYTKRKGIDIWSGSPVLVDEYNFITQPSYSNMSFSINSYIEYNKRDIGSITWKQPIDVTVEVQNKKWCKILVDTNNVSNLSATLYNNINDIIVSATNISSDIVLDVIQDKPLLINYYARNGFIWTQEVSNSSLGLPPTGGIWVPIENDDLVTPTTPYAHLSNRHYPTYASVPSIGDLYTTKDSGGYFIPRLLGVSTAISKQCVNELNTSKIDNNQGERGVTAIYRDLEIYNSDRGLSNNDQFEPVLPISVDSSWMKASVMEGQKNGMIVQAKAHQEFMPYQSKYESIGSNDNGLYRQGNDAYDPWFGDLDNTWENEIDWPSNWRKQYDIKGWYEQQDKGDQQVYQWKTDIFGNQYAVLKSNYQYASIYNKKHNTPGSLWTRNTRNIIEPADVSLAGVFEFMPLGIDVSSMSHDTSAVLDIDIWFDTLMIYTSSVLFFFHLNFDFDTGIISSTSDEINYIITENSKFGGTWFFEDDKRVTICTLMSCGDQIRPILRSLNLETNQIDYLYNLTSTYTDMSNYGLTGYDHPILTYDSNTKTYNISYISEKDGMYLTTINIRDYGEYYDIVSSKTITPVS